MDKPNRSSRTGTSLLSVAVLLTAILGTNLQAEVLATVNGAEIDEATFELYLQNRVQKPAEQITDEDREMVLNELKEIYALTTLPRAEELAKDSQFKAQIELQYRASLAQTVATDWLANNPATDEEIEAAYEDQKSLAPDTQFKASHILVETQAAANDLIRQLDDGADFAELAKENSTGPSGPSGGDLGWFSPTDMVAPFSDAVSKLEDGAYTSSPVQTQFGWHVILRQDSRENEPPPLESVRDAVKQSVEQKNFQEYLDSLQAKDDN